MRCHLRPLRPLQHYRIEWFQWGVFKRAPIMPRDAANLPFSSLVVRRENIFEYQTINIQINIFFNEAIQLKIAIELIDVLLELFFPRRCCMHCK